MDDRVDGGHRVSVIFHILELFSFTLFGSCSFFESLAPALRPVLPAPIVTSMMVSGGDATARLDLSGRHFTTRLTVWFGDQKAETILRCAAISFD